MLEKLPTVRAGGTGTITYRYSATNRFNRSGALADSAPGRQPDVFHELLGFGVVA